MKEIPIIITVDTEGDNLWDWKPGKTIETKNSQFILPFQQLCERYQIPPVYLINYEMIMSDSFVSFVKEKAEEGLCEIGMHLHAWNSPPEVELNKSFEGNPYITEYSKNEIYEKHKYLRDLIVDRTGIVPVSYRSGRWATNDMLFEVLSELGFCVDCSVTPGINHKSPGATIRKSNNYRKSSKLPYKIKDQLWEIPMTTDIRRTMNGKNYYRKAINCLRGEERWLRPALQTTDEMLRLIDDVLNDGAQYLMIMIHSSELMPGGSPYCKTQEDVDEFLKRIENVILRFCQVSKGYSLQNYYKTFLKE